MKSLRHLIFSLLANLVALLAAAYLVTGFNVEFSLRGLVTVTAALTIINFIIRPILKLILTPLIIITLGLFTLVINAALLLALDFYLGNLTIEGLVPLVLATLVISFVNFILHFFHRH